MCNSHLHRLHLSPQVSKFYSVSNTTYFVLNQIYGHLLALYIFVTLLGVNCTYYICDNCVFLKIVFNKGLSINQSINQYSSFCSYKRDAIEKLKMSNGGVTDVYLSNSRCVRNNDKPVDNNVFTGRLPVSAGPQHHQWQQQHQQLLMQADDNA